MRQQTTALMNILYAGILSENQPQLQFQIEEIQRRKNCGEEQETAVKVLHDYCCTGFSYNIKADPKSNIAGLNNLNNKSNYTYQFIKIHHKYKYATKQGVTGSRVPSIPDCTF